EEQRLACDQCHRLEILHQVVFERIEGAVRDVLAPTAETQRVTITRRSGDPSSANAARGAGHVFNDDRFTEAYPHPLGNDAGNGVHRAARWVWHNDCDRSRRIVLRRCWVNVSHCDDGERRQERCPYVHLWSSSAGGSVRLMPTSMIET